MTFTVFVNAASNAALRLEDSSVPMSLGIFDKFIPVTMAEGSHPFPFRTRPLSPPAPMVLPA